MTCDRWTSIEREILENHAEKSPKTIQQMLIDVSGKKRTIEAIEYQIHIHNKKNKTS